MRIKKYIKAIYKLTINSSYRFLVLSNYGLYDQVDDITYLKRKYKASLSKELDLTNPQTFNEKLQWLKLYDRKPEYTMMVDKYAVKQYVADIIGEEYIIPTLGVWDHFDDIDFGKLPNQFVLKCTHDSGGLVICKDKSKLDILSAKKKIERSLRRNYYWSGREWPYKNVKPRIIAEPYMEDKKTHELIDYKFMCFNGRVKCSFTCNERFSKDGLKVTFFDTNWNVLPFKRHYSNSKITPIKPLNYDKMILFSSKLSKDIAFVRIDFYEINRRLYFGEITFYPGSGFEEFTPEEWDYKLGSWLELPRQRSK